MNERPRSRLTRILLDKVASDRYPSVTQLDRVEAMIGDREAAERYVNMLLDLVEQDRYPSPTMLDRAERVAGLLDAAGT